MKFLRLEPKMIDSGATADINALLHQLSDKAQDCSKKDLKKYSGNCRLFGL